MTTAYTLADALARQNLQYGDGPVSQEAGGENIYDPSLDGRSQNEQVRISDEISFYYIRPMPGFGEELSIIDEFEFFTDGIRNFPAFQEEISITGCSCSSRAGRQHRRAVWQP